MLLYHRPDLPASFLLQPIGNSILGDWPRGFVIRLTFWKIDNPTEARGYLFSCFMFLIFGRSPCALCGRGVHSFLTVPFTFIPPGRVSGIRRFLEFLKFLDVDFVVRGMSSPPKARAYCADD